MLGLFVLLLVFFSGFVTARVTDESVSGEPISSKLQFVTGQDSGRPQEVSFAKFWEAWQIVDNNFFGDANKVNRVDGAISGMLFSLGDPYTVYLPKDENDIFRADLTGQITGIGAEIGQINGLPTIVTPLPGSPAEKAGAKPKDIIIKVDELETQTSNFAEVINSIRGTVGTTVALTIIREGEPAEIVLKITREVIKIPSLTYEIKEQDGVRYGLITLSQFLEDTYKGAKAALEDFQSKGVDKIIVDVRNNPGGLLDVSIDVASIFIDTAVKPEFNEAIVKQKDRNDKVLSYKASKKSILNDEKVIVLVNEGSASAAEIFAGAISDYGRGRLVGTTTFGKGSVQELKNLADGSSVKVTTAKWFTPNDSTIDQVGIKPDVIIEEQEDNDSGEEKSDNVLDAAIELLKD